MHLEIVIMLFVSVVSANIVHTKYKLTYGNGASHCIAYLYQISRDKNLVSIGISETNQENYELLDHTWMENRTYKSGYTYYEKVVVDEVFTEQPSVEPGEFFYWNISGPLTTGTKITVLYSPPATSAGFINIIGDNVEDVIYFHMDTRAHYIVYDQFYGGWLFAGCKFYPTQDLSAEVLDLGLVINEHTIHVSINGSYTCDIQQQALGDIRTYLYIIDVTLYRIKYERPM